MNDIDPTHYTRTVTQLGDRKAVIANEAIYTDANIKLVERGSRINSELFDRLTRHKLLKPLDENLSIEELVSHSNIIGLGEQLLRNDPVLQLFEVKEPLKYRLSNIVNRIPLPTPIDFKLTVAREERPELYSHSVLNLLLAIYIAAQAGYTLEQSVDCASAALLHDLGLLHIDPVLLERQRTLDDNERKHLYAHPLISYLLLKPFDDYSADVKRAVYAHHERLDGSGYPRSLLQGEIGDVARVLAITEVISSRFDAEGRCQGCQQLEFILKMNTHKLDPKLLTLLTPLLGKVRRISGEGQPGETSAAEVSACLTKLLSLVQQWRALGEQLEGAPQRSLEGFINDQLESLSTTLSYAGLDLSGLQELIQQCGDDPETLQDFLGALQEVRWQLKGLRNELGRRWPEELKQVEEPALKAWLEKLQSV